MVYIQESGVTFGNFEQDSLFQIEHWAKSARLNNVKICEFVLKKGPDHYQFVEAKSSIPKPTDKEYPVFMANIVEKMENTLTLTMLGILGRHPEIGAEISEYFKEIDWANAKFELILVIPEIPNKFLPPISDKLKQELKRLGQIWNIKGRNIRVLNREKAIQIQLLES